MARNRREGGDGRGGGNASRGRNFPKLYSFDVPVPYPKTKATEQKTKIKPQNILNPYNEQLSTHYCLVL